ncbi:MAG: manganese efflux pump [Clostridia bacterium]|nr:manganese efflux pump [Clostridia bacterium]
MSLIELFFVAVGLSMDAFAVAICKGLACKKVRFVHCLITGLFFGLFQAGMPLAGYLLGEGFSDRITAVDHWISFFLLFIIGAKMLLDARRGDDLLDASFSCSAMLPLALATSVDALAIGVGFAFLKIRILPAVLLIGLTTFILSSLGVYTGSFLGSRFRKIAEIAGGIILILLGGKILADHLLSI